MIIEAMGYEWLAHNTVSYAAGSSVSLYVKPFNIQIMKHMDESERIIEEDVHHES